MKREIFKGFQRETETRIEMKDAFRMNVGKSKIVPSRLIALPDLVWKIIEKQEKRSLRLCEVSGRDGRGGGRDVRGKRKAGIRAGKW